MKAIKNTFLTAFRLSKIAVGIILSDIALIADIRSNRNMQSADETPRSANSNEPVKMTISFPKLDRVAGEIICTFLREYENYVMELAARSRHVVGLVSTEAGVADFLSSYGIRFDPQQIEVILYMQPQRTGAHLQQFFCALQCVKNVIPNFRALINPFQNFLETSMKALEHL